MTAARLKRFIATENVEGIIQMVMSLSNYQNLTCETRDSLVVIIQQTASKVAMKATDVAGFASSLRALLKSDCLHLSEHRILSDDNILNALNLTNDLILNSQVAGLDPTAQYGFSESLSQALDLISNKNFIRRRLKQTILNSDSYYAEWKLSDKLLNVPTVRSLTQNEDPGKSFILAATNFATSQLVGALPGEDERILRAKSMDMISARRIGQGFSGKRFGGERTFFELPKEFLNEVRPVNAYFLSLTGSPFYTDFEVKYVTSLSFEKQKITELDVPIIIHLQPSRPTSESICPINTTSQGNPNTLSECEDSLLEHCRFWNGSGWDRTGCIVDEIDIAGRNLKCHCYHLTEFASVPFDSISSFDHVNPIMLSAQTARLQTIQIVVVSIVCSSLLLYLIMCYWGWRRDIEDNIKSNMRNHSHLNPAGIIVESATLKRSLEPEEEKAIFSSKNSKLLKRAFKEKYVISLMIVKSKILLQFTSEHKLFGCFTTPKNHFTRPRRITVLFCTVQGIMMINTIFCGDEGNTFVQKLVGGILASLIVLPISMFFR
uniref:GPS domain-containing protein n=1 Tax=Cryptomonas curvata TaxID=233186 RepID=A0A7S0R012_9CRYP